jgi:L-rhamnose isomerase
MSYEKAKDAYNEFGVDVEKALETAAATPISIHCWQGDDVTGFDTKSADTGGIQATGNYPGKARNFNELKADFAKACSFIPGRKRINLHASYGVFTKEIVERNAIQYEHYAPWVDYAREMGIGIDFNPTCFGHSKVKDGLTLSSPDGETQAFWIEHCKRSRRIANDIGTALGENVLCNLWIPDGLKDIPADRIGPRKRLKEALDAIFLEQLPNVIDSVESKVFGIGIESYTAGSNEFYLSYCAARSAAGNVYPLLDNGHFHPTENVADKISALALFFDCIPFHITRPMRWDSDHVTLFNDELRELFLEITRSGALSKARIGLDFFDASINRTAAWVIGTRAAQKALLYALLSPSLCELQNSGDFTQLLAVQEDIKLLPFSEIWTEYLKRQNIPQQWYNDIKDYEKEILRIRQ